MKAIYKKLPAALAIAAAGILGLGSGAAQAQGKTITLCWAAWDPANALVELSKEFTAKTKVNMAHKEIAQKVDEAARILQITRLLDHPVSALSAGDRQRVALGRAIVRQPLAFMRSP